MYLIISIDMEGSIQKIEDFSMSQSPVLVLYFSVSFDCFYVILLPLSHALMPHMTVTVCSLHIVTQLFYPGTALTILLFIGIFFQCCFISFPLSEEYTWCHIQTHKFQELFIN